MGGGMSPEMGGEMSPDMGGSDLDSDSFSATSAAVGGSEELGREKR
jgi:hypothetical protein